MNHHTAATHSAARLVHALLRALPLDDASTSTESELLKHFPFARTGQEGCAHDVVRVPTTVHGLL